MILIIVFDEKILKTVLNTQVDCNINFMSEGITKA